MNFEIENEYLKVIASEKGAELQSIQDVDGIEYLWQGNPDYWADRALTLFPCVARLHANQYTVHGKTYHMDIHGFAPYRFFQGHKVSGTCMEFTLTDCEATLQIYPWKFLFSVQYELKNNRIEVTYVVKNHDTETMYFGLGGHPGFRVPIVENSAFGDYSLRFSHTCTPIRLGFTDNSTLNGKKVPFLLKDGIKLPLTHELFDQDAIVLSQTAKTVTLESQSDPHSITVSFPQMDYIGFWQWPGKKAPYVCIEPWCSLPAKAGEIPDFTKKADLICLRIGETYKNCWTIQINKGKETRYEITE